MRNINQSVGCRGLAVLGVVCLAAASPGPSWGQRALPACEGLVFSIEEDFRAGNRPPDGNDVISDGDLLRHNFPNPGAEVCARNRDLLRVFEIRVDLGLDAADVIDPKGFLVAFSTELDDPARRFTAGDLLATNGAVIPNGALLARFERPEPREDMGLDAVHFVGEPAVVVRFLESIAQLPPNEMRENPGLLLEYLRKYELDIWFSTEGTGFPPEKPSFLDGDLLSVQSGTIVESNADLLPALPAGVPDRGVDYGLDAFTVGHDRIEQIRYNLFSTEIVSLDRVLSFTDGDMLRQGGGVVRKNIDLIGTFEPRARDLGLDALDFGDERPCDEAISIDEVGGFQVTLIDPVTGYAQKINGSSPPSGPGGPYVNPFGSWVSLRGTVPDDRCIDPRDYEYRLEFRGPSTGWTAITTHANWQAPRLAGCAFAAYQSDAAGWIPLTHYWRARSCQPNQVLNMWRTSGLDRAHRVRLTVRQNGNAATEVFSPEVIVALDNVAPVPVEIDLYDASGTVLLADQCEVGGSEGDTVITIKGRVRDRGQGGDPDGDEHFRRYDLNWTGGDLSGWNSVDLTGGPGERYYDGGRLDLGDDGTEPPGANDVWLGTFNLTAEHLAATGNAAGKCGYTVWLRARDRAILGGFNPPFNTYSDINSHGWIRDATQSFCFEPV